MQYFTTNFTFNIHANHNAPVKQQILNHIILKTIKTFRGHEQEALDMLAIVYSAELCLVSAQ